MSRRSVSLLTNLRIHVPKHSALLVAVSGGKDSIALLDGLVRLQRMLKLRLEVAHVDHGLRPSSSEDADFVEQLAKAHNLKFHKNSLLPPTSKVNIESWGRAERYKFFKEVLERQNLNFVVTAHQSNDVAETFLMRLVSNKELRSIHARNKKYRILRPLLNVSRKEIERYIKHYQLSYKEDQTNTDCRFLRNKVRSLLIPHLCSNFHARISEWNCERALTLDRDSRCLDQLARKEIEKLASVDFNQDVFVNLIKNQPAAIALRIIEFALLERLGYRLGRARAETVRKLIVGRINRCSLPGGYILKREKGLLNLEHPSAIGQKS